MPRKRRPKRPKGKKSPRSNLTLGKAGKKIKRMWGRLTNT